MSVRIVRKPCPLTIEEATKENEMKAFILICLMAATGCVTMEGLRQGPPVPGSEKDGKPAASSRLSYNGVASPDTAVALTALDNERIMIEGQVANERLLIRSYGQPHAMGGAAGAYAGYGMAQGNPAAATDKDAEQDGRLDELDQATALTVDTTSKVLGIVCSDDPNKKRPPECDEKPKQ